jgi:hypothetical protein
MTTPPSKPRSPADLLVRCADGLQRLSFDKALKHSQSLNIEPSHVPLLRAAARQSAPFIVRRHQLQTGGQA